MSIHAAGLSDLTSAGGHKQDQLQTTEEFETESVKHKSLSLDRVEEDRDSPASLSIDDTQDVYEAMYDAQEKWYNIGGVFRIPESELISIGDRSESDELKLRRVIVAWLHKNIGSKNCNWNAVIQALRNKTVNREDLASKVVEDHVLFIASGDLTSGKCFVYCHW